jgi:hypothetical protein
VVVTTSIEELVVLLLLNSKRELVRNGYRCKHPFGGTPILRLNVETYRLVIFRAAHMAGEHVTALNAHAAADNVGQGNYAL